MDTDEDIIQYANQPYSGDLDLVSSRYRKRIVYQPNGTAGGSNLTMTFCVHGQAVAPKALVLSNMGRPRVAELVGAGRSQGCG
jgi:type IV fimbrial biogenesis protein FimT